ncbi:RNA polymerase sigma factor [Alicyclobacillus mengziensis]|uniref:RNA polymerase sigma factor n=1 Tax=Alicyclobacillus mengziensis TaxID=2931921 RepID=A0A9X7W0E4_9BACL|nr:RNA polymerase sigma factor [Alicyclobacillus mengziensis]QSO48448.1 RNA polymerase sigma factor [Alicyclobacillus mengziensis]
MDVSEEIVKRVGLGDEEAFSELFQTTWKHAVRTCWLILRNKHDAEETAQEAFLKLYVHRAELREVSTFWAWFYRILTNTALDRIRKRKPHSDVDNVPIVDPTSGIQRAEHRMQISQAMGKLSYDERVAVVLVLFNDLTEKEAAKAAGWRLGKLKYRLNRARRILARDLQQDSIGVTKESKGGIQRV